MAETKYGKYIMREPHAKLWPRVPLYVDSTLISGISCDIAFSGHSEAAIYEHPAHKHDADEFLFFIGGDPRNILDFGAEVELSLGWGAEQEKHTINTTSVVYISKGLVHLPMNFKKVDKPILTGHILLAPTFSETKL